MLRCTAVLTLAAGLVACGNDSGGNGPDPDPAPSTLAVTTPTAPPPVFIPATGRVAVGGTVTWTNGSLPSLPAQHDITSNDNKWEARNLLPGESFSVTFDEPGAYGYRCTIHQGMTGVIRVE